MQNQEDRKKLNININQSNEILSVCLFHFIQVHFHLESFSRFYVRAITCGMITWPVCVCMSNLHNLCVIYIMSIYIYTCISSVINLRGLEMGGRTEQL